MAGIRQTPNSNMQSVTLNYTASSSGQNPQLQVINSPGGSNAQIQFNAGNGSFGGSPNMIWNNANRILNVLGTVRASNIQGKITTNLTNFKLTGGNVGDTLTTDGTGNLIWVEGENYGNSNVANYLPNYSGNINSANINISNTVYTSNLSVTGVSFLTTVSVNGVMNTHSITANGNVTANYFIGNVTFAATAGEALEVAVSNVTGIGNIALINLDGNASNALLGNGSFGPIDSTSSFLSNSDNSFALDGDGNVVFQGSVAGQGINRGMVWDYGANVGGVNSEVRQDNSGLTVRAWTENLEGTFAAPVRIVTNQDATENVWSFDGQGNLTVPGNINAINDGGQLGAYLNLNPNLGQARLLARDAETNVNYTSTSWTSATYTGTQIDFVDAPDLVTFFTNNQFNVGVNQTFSINGDEPVIFQGYTIGVGNDVIVYTDIAADPNPTTVTSIDFYYQLESSVGVDYDDGGLNINATGLTINIDNDQTSGPDINLRSGDDITLQAKDKALGSESEGGDINIYAGDGADDDGLGNTASTGGDIQIDAGRGGDGNSSSGEAGGFTRIRGGTGGSAGVSSNAGPGGYVEIRGGNGGNDLGNTSLGAGGGNIIITAGDSTQEGTIGAYVTISSGQGGPNALAGNVEIFTPSSAIGLGGIWRFDGNGNLTLPAYSVIRSVGNNAGDLSGLSTLNLYPDNSTGDDRYLVIDPTGPNHIHIRAGGDQDASNTLLFLGGEQAYVQIDDYVHEVQIGSYDNANATSYYWRFENDGQLTIPGNLVASGASPAPTLSGFSSLSAADQIVVGSNAVVLTTSGDVSATGNISATNIGNIAALDLNGNASQVLYGNGVFATVSGSGTSITNGNSNVNIATANGNVTITAVGNNVVTITGTGANITGNAYVSGTANTGVSALVAGATNTLLSNTVAGFTGNVNSYTQVTFQNKSNGADATADFILTADNGNDTVNYGDFGIINSGYDNNTPTNSLGNIVFSADTYIYAQGNVSNTSQSGGNLVIGTTTLGKSVKVFAGGTNSNSIVATFSNTGVNVNGNVTANNFIGNISITGNIQGTSSNVSLVAGSFTATFDNTGVLTLPTNGGDEGGELRLGVPATNTTLTSRVTVDVYQDRFRIFDGSTKGVYVDLSQAGTSVSTLLNNRVSAFVNAGTFVTMDNIKATVTTIGNRGLSLATVSGSFTYNIGGNFGLSGSGSGGQSLASQTLTTTPTSSIFGWGFSASGDIATYILTDTTNSRCYRITVQIGASFNNNSIVIERLI